jgi:hypothetical protein
VTVTGYEQLAKNLVETIPKVTFTRSYGNTEEASQPPLQQPEAHQPTQRKHAPRADWADRRDGWVRGNDTVANRDRGKMHPHGSRGSWRGQRGQRGGRGGRFNSSRGGRGQRINHQPFL